MPEMMADHDEQIVDQFKLRLGRQGIDPITIITIISAIIQVLSSVCRPTAAQLQRGGPLVRARLFHALRVQAPEMSKQDRMNATDAALRVAAEASVKENERFMMACSR